MKKRILASLLSLCLIVGLLPAAALAADESGTEGEMPAVCTCTALCTEGSVDETCPVCAEDYNSCAYEEAPAEPAEEPGDEPVDEPTEGPAGEPTETACAGLEGCDGDTHAEGCPLYAAPVELDAELEEVPAPVEPAEENGMSGNCGAEGSENSLTWALTQNNASSENPTYTLTISGNGAMKDFTYKKDSETQKFGSDAPWYENLTRNGSTKMFPITELVIGDGVTYIGSGAFASLSVKTVSFASNVTEYGKYVFIDCALSETVDWSGFTPTAVPEGLFYGNSNLVNSKIDGTTYENKIVIPEGIDTVGTSAFLSCASLMEIDLSNITKSIGENAFGGCTSLKTVKLPAAVNSGCEESYFGTRCFNTTAIETITLPNNVTTISQGMFNRCGLLTDVVSTNSITKIGETAFYCDKDSTGASNHTDGKYSSFVGDSLDLSNVTEIGKSAFSTCTSLKSIIRLDSIQSLGERAFCDSSSVQVVDMSKSSNLGTTSQNALGNLSDGSIIYISNSNAGSLTGQYQGVYTKTKTTLAITNGGIFAEDTVFTSGTLATPIKDGYKFEGWYSKNGENDDWGTKVTESQAGNTYYAKWTKSENYSISDGDKKVSLEMTYGEQAASKTVSVNGPKESASITKVTSSSEAIKADYEGMSVTVKAADNLDAGTYTGTVYVYTGDSATHWIEVTLTVERADSSVTPSEGSGNIEATYGDTITFVAEVAKAENSIAAITDEAEQNRVAFYCEDTLLGTAVVVYEDESQDRGTATLEYDTSKNGIPTVSEQTVAAVYGGSINLNGSDTDSIKVTLSKAQPTVDISASSTSLSGGGIVTLTVNKSGLPKDAEVSVTCDNTSYNPTSNADGTYTVSLPNRTATYTFTVSYAGNEWYNEASDTCTVSVTRTGGSSGGGGGSSSSSHSVSVDSDKNGTVSVNKDNASQGSTVTITVKPDSGYELGDLIVTDKNGNEIKLTDKGNGKYTFKMPGSKVEIEASFVPQADPDIGLPFNDIPSGSWYEDAVWYVYENGLMAGTSDTTFEPDTTTSRGMIVTVLYRLEGAPTVSGASAFTDVADGQYYADAVAWAAANNIVGGYGNGLFGPNDTITREQMAAILYRYAQYKGYDVTASTDLSDYSDVAQVSSYALAALQWANAEGLVNGTSDTTLTPGGSATRAQVAVILMRFCENIAEK